MPDAPDRCVLCGLPLRYGKHRAVFSGRTLNFCCGGCQMVYTMLMEATESPAPSAFKKSPLYKRCVRAGVVPASEDDLAEMGKGDLRSRTETTPTPPKADTLGLQLKVEGMWCPACAWVIESALNNVTGVQAATCDFATDRLRCRYDPARVDPDTINGAIRGLGYTPVSTEGHPKGSLWHSEFVRLTICALLSANVMMLSWALYSGIFTSLNRQDIYFISLPIWALATVVMLYGGGHLFRKAWWGIRARAPGMEALVCLGAGSAYLYSLYNFFSGSWHLYFDTASMLITLVLLGKWLEAKAKARVRYDLEGFLALQPNKVRLCTPAFPQGRFVALTQLVPGDHFRVQAHEMVPADGRIASGQGLVDESAVTGESRPRKVAQGHSLTSGTILVEGNVTVVARLVGPASLMGQMIAVIESSLVRRTPLESRTDRWLALFVPVMVGLAAATTLVGAGLGLAMDAAFERGLTVLVIACPCALGIAIPLARIAGISKASRRGMLVRDFEAFERTRTVQSVVMDKTGTLTRGNWSLAQLSVVGQMDADHALALAAGLEHGVEHVVARAIWSQARQQGISPLSIEHIQCHENGVSGFYKGRSVKIGSWDFVAPEKESAGHAPLAKAPLSNVYLSMNQEICAVLGFGDTLRPETDTLIQQLKRAGFQLHLISGDSQATTLAVAETTGIAHATGGLLPHDKAAYVARLQQEGEKVAMLGDGINDAAALAVADLSVALHRDTALGQQAAAVTLMQGHPAQFLDFLALARQVNAKVGQNLRCAWIYNLISIPVAISGLLNPLVAVTAMLLSSLTVIGNTLLLVRGK